MPELPEVQTTVDGINKLVKGKVITDVWTDYGGAIHVGKGNIKDPKYFKEFIKSIVGKKIIGATRRGKNVLIHLSGNHTILVHMKMTGHMLYGTFEKVINENKKEEWKGVSPAAMTDPFNRFIHFILSLSDKKFLALSDMRKFAKVTLIETDKIEQSEHLKSIGPEPLDKSFTYSLFKERLHKKKTGKIKTVLMTPDIIAGVGNIYSDEALWLAGIHPEMKAEKIPEEKMKILYQSVKKVLLKGIDFGGDSMSDYRNLMGERGEFQGQHNAYRKTGTPCKKKDGGIITRKIVGGRSAHFCNVHQQLNSKVK